MSQYVLLRIQSLQEELESLKKIVSHQLLQNQRKTTYIKGLSIPYSKTLSFSENLVIFGV
jgi:hypothetical protein